MSKRNFQNKKSFNDYHSSCPYFAVKAKDDVFYQMASIFKEITKDKESESKELFSSMLPQNTSDIFLENQV